MEIVVQGNAERCYIPNQVLLRFRFCEEGASYEEVFQKGTDQVLAFVNAVLLPQGFSKEDLKTDYFQIQKEKKYNENTNTYDFLGYSYHQNATLKFDYEGNKLSLIMEEIATLSTPPLVNVDFTIKDIQMCKKDILELAYQDAYNQASIIACAAGKTLKNCMKVDFQPFTTEYVVRGYETVSMASEKGVSMRLIGETMNTIFTPQDVKVSETLYCLWIAE